MSDDIPAIRVQLEDLYSNARISESVFAALRGQVDELAWNAKVDTFLEELGQHGQLWEDFIQNPIATLESKGFNIETTAIETNFSVDSRTVHYSRGSHKCRYVQITIPIS